VVTCHATRIYRSGVVVMATLFALVVTFAT
jgi:hypothetical protein